MSSTELRRNDRNARKDHECIRNQVGYYDFTHQLLEVTGLDARSFLSRLFVGGISKAKVGQAKYTTMVDDEGVILDDVIIFRIEEDTFWISTLFIQDLIRRFDRMRTTESVSYRDITENTTMYAVQGPRSGDTLDALLRDPVRDLKQFRIRENAFRGIPVKVARSGYTGELGYEIYCKPGDARTLEEALEQAGRPYGIQKITTDVIVTSLPREKGFVLMSDLAGLTPLEAGFGWSIDWNKEFIGKAALEKEKQEGSTRELLGFTVEDPDAQIEPGADVVYNHKVVGRVTTFTYGFTLEKNIGFALVESACAGKGDTVQIEACGKPACTAVLCSRTFENCPPAGKAGNASETPVKSSRIRKYDDTARREHEAVRRRAGYYDFTHQLLEVTGLDARSFLSEMFVGAVAKLKVGQAKYTTMLNEEGTIIDDVIIFRMGEDRFWISTLYIEQLMAWFDRHKTWQRLAYRDITAERTMYAVQGPESRNLLNEFLGQKIDNQSLRPFRIMENTAEGIPVYVARSGYTGELGYEIYSSSADAPRIEELLKKYGPKYQAVPITSDVIVTSLPREKGFVLMSDLAGLTPLEAGYGWTIDWDKEFIGKEALQREKEEGSKRALPGFVLKDDTAEIPAGTEVRKDGCVIGSVTTCTYGFTVEKNIGFVLVQTDRAQIGDAVCIGNYPARLTDRVFYDPDNQRSRM